MTSTLKIDTVTTLDGTGNITFSRPIVADISNVTGILPAISGAALTNLPAGGYTELGVAATTSGSSSTIGSIPAGVKTVLIIWNKISCTGAAEVNMQLGDSGGLETSGYLSNNHKHTTSSGHYHQFADTAHFGITDGGGGADPFATVMNLTRSASGVNDWVVTWICYQSTEPAQTMGCGMKTLSGELTQIAVITNGTFDAGNWNAYYQ